MFTKRYCAISKGIDSILESAHEDGARDLTRKDVSNLRLGPEWTVKAESNLDSGKNAVIKPIFLKNGYDVFATVYDRKRKRFFSVIDRNLGEQVWLSEPCRSLKTLIEQTYQFRKEPELYPRLWNLIDSKDS